MKKIPFTENYFADKFGNIYSTSPFKRSKNNRTEPIKITPQKTPNGYSIVNVKFNGVRKSMAVGYLVLLTFISDRPSKNHHVCHGVNGKSDNSLENISWGTISKNNFSDKIRDGKLLYGEKHPNSKLTNDSVKEIRTLFDRGFNQKEIADIFKVHHSNISCILKGKTWGHVV